MRHGKSGNRLSRNQSLRKATLRDMAKAVLIQERICTTSAKAKEAATVNVGCWRTIEVLQHEAN